MFKKAALGLCFALIVLFDSPIANAAQTYYLPRQFSPGEMSTVGIALVNPIAAAASATFRWRTSQGAVFTTTQRAIPAKGQFSLLLSQLFPGMNAAGWLSVDVDLDQVSGFWLGGDFINSTDGAPLVNSRSAVPAPAFVFLRSKSEISFVNAGPATVNGFLALYNSNGSDVLNVLFDVPAFGVFQQSVASLFPAYANDFDSNAYWIRVDAGSDARIVGTTLTTTTRDNIVTNAVAAASNQFVFPQVVGGQVGGSRYDTQLSLANLQTSPQTVTLTLNRTSGTALTVQRNIAPAGALRASITSLFNITSVDGWLLVTTAGGNIIGLVTYTDSQTGGMAAVEMQAQPADISLVFGHIADLNPWWTGIALVNPSNTIAQIEVYAVDSTGNLIGGPAQNSAASFSLAGQSKKTFLLSEVVPATQTRIADGGYVYVRSTNGVALYGTELFFLRNGSVYSSVAAVSLVGTSFSPPTTPATNSIQVSVAPSSPTIQTGTTLQFIAGVSGTANTSVTWSVNNINGGNSTVGTINADGLYTAPANIPDSNPVTIKATSAADVTRPGTASVILVPAITSATSRFLTITSGPPPPANAGVASVFNFTAAGGRPPYSWAATGPADNGLTLNRTTGILSGTPTYNGALPIVVEVTDADGLKDTVQYEMQFNGFGSTAFIINSPSTAMEGSLYYFKFVTTWMGAMCTPSVTLISGSLPPGIVLDSAEITLTGTPLVAGAYTFTVVATGGGINCTPPAPARTNMQTFTLIVDRLSGQGTRGASNWVRTSDFPVLVPSSGTWDGFAIRSGSVVSFFNDIYVARMYYEGEDPQTHTRQIGLATTLDGVRWTKLPANPILRPGPAGSKDAIDLRSPSVHFDSTSGMYRMWYSGIDDRDGCASIMLATSVDGISWTKSPSNPLNLSNCSYIPGSVIKTAGVFMMWYGKKPGGIGVATSTDGIQWTDRGTVIANFGDISVANPAVVLDSGVYRMWFNMTSANKAALGFATSSDGITWTVLQDSDNNVNTVFSAGTGGAWDRPGVGQASVIIDPNDSLFKMWYIGGPIDAPFTGSRATTFGSVGSAKIPN
jgi:putative Ig domain-containing protein/glycosyl hydrolase family 32